jgi:hypothetical protein
MLGSIDLTVGLIGLNCREDYLNHAQHARSGRPSRPATPIRAPPCATTDPKQPGLPSELHPHRLHSLPPDTGRVSRGAAA